MHFKLPKSDEIFSYYLPHKELSAYIAYYSVQHRQVSTIAPVFIPDLGGSIIVSRRQSDLDMMVWGPFSQLTTIEQNSFEVVGRYFIEFQPGGLSRLVYPNSNEILNKKLPLGEVDIALHRFLRPVFEQHFYTADSLISSLDDCFLRLLGKRRDAFANGRHIINLLQDFRTPKTMDDLSVITHYSSRQINRYVNALTGVSGKGYFRIRRINQAVELLKKSTCSIEQAAFALDYYDAAHFVHDFTELCGVSPTLFLKNRSGFYNEVLKRF